MTALKLSWMFVPWFQPRHLYISSFRRICSPAHWRPTSLSSGLRMDTPCVQSQEKLGSTQPWMRRSSISGFWLKVSKTGPFSPWMSILKWGYFERIVACCIIISYSNRHLRECQSPDPPDPRNSPHSPPAVWVAGLSEVAGSPSWNLGGVSRSLPQVTPNTTTCYLCKTKQV